MTRIIFKDEVSEKAVKYRKIVDSLINDGKGMPVSKQVLSSAVGDSFYISNEWVGFEFKFNKKDKLRGVYVRFGFKGRYDEPIKLGSLTLSKTFYAPSSLTCNGELFLVKKGEEVLLTFECRKDAPRGITSVDFYLDYKRGDFRLSSGQLRLPVAQGIEIDYEGEAKFLDRVENMYRDVSSILRSRALIPKDYSRMSAGLLPIPIVKVTDKGEAGSGLLFGVTRFSCSPGVKSLHISNIQLFTDSFYFHEKRSLLDMSEESLIDLYNWIFEYNVFVFDFCGDYVLLEFPDNPECCCKEIIFPTRTLFSKFKFVNVTSGNLPKIVNPFMHGKSKVASSTYYSKCEHSGECYGGCECGEEYRHFESSPGYKIFKGNMVEVFCNKIEEIHDDLVKQL